MDRAIFIFHKDGKERALKRKLAAHLQKAGKGYIKDGTYNTRVMVAQPAQQPLMPVAITDAARQLAEENGIDIATVQGTGANGTITVADVKKVIAGAE